MNTQPRSLPSLFALVLIMALLVPQAGYGQDGALDPTFGTDGSDITDFSGGGDARAMAIQDDGKILLAGRSRSDGNQEEFALARYHPDGSLDTSFDDDGRVTTDFGTPDDQARSVLAHHGKLIVAGNASLSNDVALARYFSNNQPLADAGADQTVLAGQSVTLDGSASTDPDGDPLTYAWTLTGPGSPALSDNAAVQPTFCAAESGLYTATLTVNDGFEDSPPDAALITALSATEALDQAMTAVDDLVSEGTLNSGQAGALKRKLRQAQRLLAKGQPGEALMVLADYRMQLEDLHDEDVLNDDQQQTLADAAGAITGVLEAPCSAAAAKGAGQATASDDTPQSYRLGSYPNPFNPAATVAFALPERAAVSLAVYDVLGREVARLVEGSLEAGAHAVRFEAGALPSGTYLVRLEAGAQVRTHRVVLLK